MQTNVYSERKLSSMQYFGRLCAGSIRSKQRGFGDGCDPPPVGHSIILKEPEETFWVHVKPVVASFWGDDGVQTDVPLHALQRSQYLRNALDNALEGEKKVTSVFLPRGALQGWLRCLRDLGIVTDDASSSTSTYKLYGLLRRTLRVIKAVDFLNDQDSLDHLVSRAVICLYPPHGAPRTQMRDIEALNELPVDLVVKILTACKKTFARHLEVLPPVLHLAALHASYPSITASASLTVESIQCQEQIDDLAPYIALLNNLTSLSISGSSYRAPFDGEVVAFSINRMPQLQTIALKHFYISVWGAVAIAVHFKAHPHLQELELVNCFDEFASIKPLLMHISCLRSLKVLDIEGNCVKDEGAQLLAARLSALRELSKLSLASCLLESEDIKTIAAKLTSLKLLEHLDFSQNSWPADDSSCKPVLPCLPSLQVLNLKSSGVGPLTILRPFADELWPRVIHLTGLHSLELSSNCGLYMGEWECISALSHLRTFVVFNCLIDRPDDRVALSDAILELKNLEKLDLGRNALYSLEIMDSVANLQHLTWLGLSAIGIHNRLDGMHIKQALSELQLYQKLNHLDVSCNVNICDREAWGVQEALCGFTSLRSLNISNTDFLTRPSARVIDELNLWDLQSFNLGGLWTNDIIGADLLDQLAYMKSLTRLELRNNLSLRFLLWWLGRCISKVSSLTYLGLANCMLGDEGMTSLASSIEKMSALREIDVQVNGLSAVGWGALIDVLHREPEIVCVHVDSSFRSFSNQCSAPMHHMDVIVHDGLDTSW